MKFLIILLFFISTRLIAQIYPYILSEDFGDKKKGDTLYIMNKETRDILYEVMYDNLAKDTIISSYDTALIAMKQRISIRDSIDAARKEQIENRQEKIAALKENKFFNIKGIFFEVNVTYIPKLVPLYEAGFLMNIDIFDVITIGPGFKAFYFNSEFNVGPTLRLGVKLY